MNREELNKLSDIDKLKHVIESSLSEHKGFNSEFWKGSAHMGNSVLDAIQQIKKLNKQNINKAEGVSLPDSEYWKQRCILMEAIDEKSPCDPDITSDQIKAYANYHNFIKAHGQRQ